jgi:5-methylcytosine-specific restriction endonuclease McrA
VKRTLTWSERREQFLTNHLRRVSIQWPAAAEAKRRARVGRRVNPQTGRLCWFAVCEGCQSEFKESELVVDHVQPVVAVERDYSESAYSTAQLGELVERLLPSPDGLQLLCFECHSAKTEAENEDRIKTRKDQG